MCVYVWQGSTGGIQEKVREFMDIFTSEMKHLQGLSQTTGHQSTAQTEVNTDVRVLVDYA